MTKTDRGPFTLGQLGKLVGLSRASLLYYESLGLLTAKTRSTAGYRLYGEPELLRLQTIRQFRSAGLAMADIGALLGSGAEDTIAKRARPARLLENRLFALCREMERIRGQQRLLARLLAVPGRDTRFPGNKESWVAFLKEAGFDEEAMRQWHVEFERESPREHAAFLLSLGIKAPEAKRIRGWALPRKSVPKRAS